MKIKMASFFLAILMIMSSFFVTASSVNVKTNSNINNKISPSFLEDAELPEWFIGSYWKYDMEFSFLSREEGSITFTIEAAISDLYATVVDIVDDDGEEVYVLNLNGYILGVVSLFVAEIEIADFRGPLTGTALIGTNTLGIKKFIFDFNGEVNIPLLGWNDMFFDMTMSFTPCFDFFDFPIIEGEPDWDVTVDPATLEATVDIPVLGPIGDADFSSSMVFNDIMSVKGTEEITVPAGTYDTYLLGGTWGDPVATIKMHHITEIDDLDVGTDPELYYTVAVISDGTSPPPQSYHNTDDGTYNGNWVTSTSWNPDEFHDFAATSREVVTTIKVMDYDSIWELGSDDLADTSGCVGDGVDNNIYPPEPELRGAVFHGTYDLVDKKLKPYSSDPDDNADFYYKQDGYYITCGNYQPDNSQGYDGNDAEVKFKLYSDYIQPQVNAQIIDMPGVIRPYEELRFAGTVMEGAPSYIWHWNFGDGTTIEDEQNPTYTYTETGTFTVTLTVTDGFEQTGSYSFNLDVVNLDPLLSNDGVEWTGNGGTSDTFTFSVHYLDIDGDHPSIQKVFIDGTGKTMDGFGSNGEYTLNLLGSAIGSGNHKYYFYFEDGHGGSATTTEKTFTVKRSRTRNFEIQILLAELFDLFPILKQMLGL